MSAKEINVKNNKKCQVVSTILHRRIEVINTIKFFKIIVLSR